MSDQDKAIDFKMWKQYGVYYFEIKEDGEMFMEGTVPNGVGAVDYLMDMVYKKGWDA